MVDYGEFPDQQRPYFTLRDARHTLAMATKTSGLEGLVYWKTFIHARLAVAMGDHGCLSIFGDSPEQHRLFAEQLSAEYRVKTEGRGRTVDEWKMRPERSDNHWFDCLVGSAVAASMQGAILEGTEGVTHSKQKRVSFAELQRRRRG